MYRLLFLIASLSGVLAASQDKIVHSTSESVAPCLTLTTQLITSASSPCAQDGVFFLIVHGEPSFVGDSLILYVSDGKSLQRLSTIFQENLSLQIPILFPGTYTVQGFIIDKTNTYICSSDCLSVVVPSKNPDCCPLIICPNATPYIDSSQGFVSLAVRPHIVTVGPGVPYTFTCDWTFNADPLDQSSGCLIGSGGIVNAYRAGTYTAFIKTLSGTDCSSSCCSQSIQIMSDNGTGVATCDASPSYTITLPSSACATDGLISITAPPLVDNASYYLYYLTDHTTTTVQRGDSNGLVGFGMLPSGLYYLYSVVVKTDSTCCITDCIPVDLTVTGTCDVTIFARSGCGTYVDFLAVVSPSTFEQRNIELVWQFDDGSGPCIVGYGPTLRADRSGDYTVTARIASNSNVCSASNYCQTSAPYTVTITHSPLSICGTLTGCFNPESTTQQPLQLCAVPDTFTSYSWTVNGSPVSDSSSSISITPQGPGSFPVCVTVMDANGCVANSCVTLTVQEPAQVTMPGQCVCTGEKLTLEVTATASQTSCCTSNPAQLLVTGPCMFYVSRSNYARWDSRISTCGKLCNSDECWLLLCDSC